MLISKNQCKLRLIIMPKYKESSTDITFDYWKCIRLHKKAHLISDFKKKSWLGNAHKIDYCDYFGAGYHLG